jgi:hypothetical protein
MSAGIIHVYRTDYEDIAKCECGLCIYDRHLIKVRMPDGYFATPMGDVNSSHVEAATRAITAQVQAEGGTGEARIPPVAEGPC